MTISTQHILDKIRKPRVHITYDVFVGDAMEKKELPFVIGIMANLSGDPETPLPKLKDRSFVFVDDDNLEEVFAASNPRVKYQVKDVVTDSGNMVDIELKMKSMMDFSPLNIVKAVPIINTLYVKKTILNDLLVKMEGSELLRDILKLIAEDPDTRKSLNDIVQGMMTKLAPATSAADAAAAAEAKKDAVLDTEIKEEIKTAETKKKTAKTVKSAAPSATGSQDSGKGK